MPTHYKSYLIAVKPATTTLNSGEYVTVRNLTTVGPPLRVQAKANGEVILNLAELTNGYNTEDIISIEVIGRLANSISHTVSTTKGGYTWKPTGAVDAGPTVSL